MTANQRACSLSHVSDNYNYRIINQNTGNATQLPPSNVMRLVTTFRKSRDIFETSRIYPQFQRSTIKMHSSLRQASVGKTLACSGWLVYFAISRADFIPVTRNAGCIQVCNELLGGRSERKASSLPRLQLQPVHQGCHTSHLYMHGFNGYFEFSCNLRLGKRRQLTHHSVSLFLTFNTLQYFNRLLIYPTLLNETV